jgi:hypothetical protein
MAEVVILMPKFNTGVSGFDFGVCSPGEVGNLRNPSYLLVVGHSVWLLCRDLSILGKPTDSYVTAGAPPAPL